MFLSWWLRSRKPLRRYDLNILQGSISRALSGLIKKLAAIVITGDSQCYKAINFSVFSVFSGKFFLLNQSECPQQLAPTTIQSRAPQQFSVFSVLCGKITGFNCRRIIRVTMSRFRHSRPIQINERKNRNKAARPQAQGD